MFNPQSGASAPTLPPLDDEGRCMDCGRRNGEWCPVCDGWPDYGPQLHPADLSRAVDQRRGHL